MKLLIENWREYITETPEKEYTIAQGAYHAPGRYLTNRRILDLIVKDIQKYVGDGVPKEEILRKIENEVDQGASGYGRYTVDIVRGEKVTHETAPEQFLKGISQIVDQLMGGQGS